MFACFSGPAIDPVQVVSVYGTNWASILTLCAFNWHWWAIRAMLFLWILRKSCTNPANLVFISLTFSARLVAFECPAKSERYYNTLYVKAPFEQLWILRAFLCESRDFMPFTLLELSVCLPTWLEHDCIMVACKLRDTVRFVSRDVRFCVTAFLTPCDWI